MNAIIDIGNSRAKLALFDGDEIVSEHVAQGSDLRPLLVCLSKQPVEAAIMSSVVDLTDEQEAQLQAINIPLLRFTSSTPIPIRNAYHTPETLGVDRLAAAVGGWQRCNGKTTLIVDAGSCITFDMVTSDGIYLGGNISPGLHARLRAIDDYFPRLPLVSNEGDLPELGYDTETAIRAGVIQGMRHEIEGYIKHFASIHEGLCVILTGGDALKLIIPKATTLVIDQHIVERGLNAILNFNTYTTA